MVVGGITISSKNLNDPEKMSCAVLSTHLKDLIEEPLVCKMGNQMTANEYKSLVRLEIEQRIVFCSFVEKLLEDYIENTERKNHDLRDKVDACEVLRKHAEGINALREKFMNTRKQVLSGDFSMLKVGNNDIGIANEVQSEEPEDLPKSNPLPIQEALHLKRPVFTSAYGRGIQAERESLALAKLSLNEKVVPTVPNIKLDEEPEGDQFMFSNMADDGDTNFLETEIETSNSRPSLVSSLDGSITVHESSPFSKQRGVFYYSPVVGKSPPPAPNFDDSEDFSDQNQIPVYDFRSATKKTEPRVEDNETRTPFGVKEFASSGLYVQRPKFSSTYGQQFNKC